MKIFSILSLFVLTPVFAHAQIIGSGGGGLQGILGTISGLINLAIPVVIALAVLYFFWGLAQYILNSANEDKKEEGRNIMIWGIIALFVMVSVWGLVRLLQDTFGVTDQSPIIPGEIRR